VARLEVVPFPILVLAAAQLGVEPLLVSVMGVTRLEVVPFPILWGVARLNWKDGEPCENPSCHRR
jgi:hypothetical protein